MSILKSFLFLFIILLGLNTFGQKNVKVILDSKITSSETVQKRLDIATVKLIEDGKAIDSIVTHNGRYIHQLDTGHLYKIVFSKDGYVSKFLFVNTKNLPNDIKSKQKVKSTVSLFKHQAHFEVDFLSEKPIGLAEYDHVKGKIAWDKEYSKIMKEKIVDATINYSIWKGKQNKTNDE